LAAAEVGSAAAVRAADWAATAAALAAVAYMPMSIHSMAGSPIHGQV
jgi:hypothetical protein